jgi:hypothetical protein
MQSDGKDGPIPFTVLVSPEAGLAARSDVLSGMLHQEFDNSGACVVGHVLRGHVLQKFDNPRDGGMSCAAVAGSEKGRQQDVTNCKSYREATDERQQGQDTQRLVDSKSIVVCVQILDPLPCPALEKHVVVPVANCF